MSDTLFESKHAWFKRASTILDKIVGTFSYVFFKVVKNSHKSRVNLRNFVSLVRPLSLYQHPPNQCCRCNMCVKDLYNTTATLKRGKGGRNSLFSSIRQGVPFNFVRDCLRRCAWENKLFLLT